MVSTYRHPVGKQTLAGYIQVRPGEESFFGTDPGTRGRPIELLFGQAGRVTARCIRSSGASRRLKIAFTGKEGEAFRSFLRNRFRHRRRRRPSGILVFTVAGPACFRVQAETIQQATVEKLELGAQRFFAGARPITILHPAMLDLADLVQRVSLPDSAKVGRVRGALHKALQAGAWKRVASVGGGILLSAGMRRAGAQLHPVLFARDLYPALMAVAVAFEAGHIDLGVLLVADGALSRRVQREGAEQAATLDRAVRNIRALPFVIRGPVCVVALASRKTLR